MLLLTVVPSPAHVLSVRVRTTDLRFELLARRGHLLYEGEVAAEGVLSAERHLPVVERPDLHVRPVGEPANSRDSSNPNSGLASLRHTANLSWLVLGCIEADVCK